MRRSLRTLVYLVALAALPAGYVLGFGWPAGLSIGTFLSRGADAAPVAVLERRQWDFGRVTAGPVLRAAFPVRNRGDRRLVLRQKSRSCECVRPGKPEVIVPPGGCHQLVADLDTTRASGAVRMELTYWSNDPKLPTITLVVLAEIVPSSSKPDLAVQGPTPAGHR